MVAPTSAPAARRASVDSGQLPRDYERHLIATYQCPNSTPDQRASALEELTTAHIKFCHMVAKRYARSDADIDDLVNEAWIGLFRAIEKYDLARPERLLTYAWYSVNQRLARYLDNDHIIRIPVWVQDKVMKQRNLDPSRAKSASEIANATPISKESRAAYQLARRTLASLDQPESLDDNGVLGDRIPDQRAIEVETEAISRTVAAQVRAALATLPERHALVLALRFGLDGQEHSLEQVGAVLGGISRERARQIEVEARKMLKAKLDRYHYYEKAE